MMHWLAVGYGVAVVAFSATAFIAYWLDKRRAERGQTNRRIAERTLHVFALLGGWPGAFAAQRLFRHKTRKVSFQMVYWLIVAIHITAVAAALWYTFR